MKAQTGYVFNFQRGAYSPDGPGPWTFSVGRWPNGELHGTPYIYAPNAIENPTEGRHVAALCKLPELDYNARLIAAAPDLLAALERAEKQLAIAFNPGGDEHILSLGRSEAMLACNQSRAAIAKAKGQP